MGKDWKYIMYVAGAVALVVIVKLMAPKQYDWSVTFAHNDKDPYGTYALSELVPVLFDQKEIDHSYRTLYELKDSLRENDNIFILSTTFETGKEDANVLLNHLEKGGSAFISAQNMWGQFADTLNISTADYFFNDNAVFNNKDSSYIDFAGKHLDHGAQYWFRRDNIHRYFNKFDTLKTTVIARNDEQKPVTIRVRWGKGYAILNSTPLGFTNIYTLAGKNHQFISTTLSHLPNQNVYWTEYYHLGRMESQTPLRFMLSNEPLKWAYYLTIVAIILFMLFEAKRKQRIIPVIPPLANTTLEFVSTIGNLYYQRGDHKNIAEKKINFLLEQIRSVHLLPTHTLDENFIKTLARKSGNAEDEILSLVKSITFIRSSASISRDQLLDLNIKIEKFNNRGRV